MRIILYSKRARYSDTTSYEYLKFSGEHPAFTETSLSRIEVEARTRLGEFCKLEKC